MRGIAATAAFIQAACYVLGFLLLLTSMNPGNTEGWTGLDRLAFVLDRAALFQLWNIVIYVVFGVALVAMTSTLHRLLDRPDSPWMMIATPFGFIWAGLVIASGMIASVGLTRAADLHGTSPQQAADLWTTLAVVQNGLGGGVEVVGGLWVLLISLWSLRSRIVLPRWLNGIGLIVGLAGVLTIVPMLGGLGAVFGLTQIVWFLGLGIVLLLKRDSTEKDLVN
jgi:hypothetical protein